MLTPEQVMASHKASIETLVGLTQKAFEGVEKLIELNIAASKATLTESSAHTQAVLSAKDAQEMLTLQAGLFQPLAEKTAAYSRHLYDIAQGTQSHFAKVAEGKAEEAQKTIGKLVDSASANAPAGSEAAVSLVKNAVAAANSAMENMQKAVKQASETAEANFTNLTANALNATKTAATGAKKR